MDVKFLFEKSLLLGGERRWFRWIFDQINIYLGVLLIHGSLILDVCNWEMIFDKTVCLYRGWDWVENEEMILI